MLIDRLPRPTNDDWQWQINAACRGMPVSFFFHPWGERGSNREERIERAKRVCADCPVIDTCRRHALDVQEPYGVWGGLSEDERLVLLNRHRRRRQLAMADHVAAETKDGHPSESGSATGSNLRGGR